jgi:hypothetical protein
LGLASQFEALLIEMDVLGLLKDAGVLVKLNIPILVMLIVAGHMLAFLFLRKMWQRVKDQPDFKEKLK